jgi:hypothetical protein
MLTLLNEMIVDFVNDCNKKDAPKLFRIHWDGDFFNDTYTNAWKTVITNHPEIQFWVYTRVRSAAVILNGIDNLSLYYSTDSENKAIGIDLKVNNGIRLAYLAKNFLIGQEDMKELTGKKKGGAIKKPIKKAEGGAITGDDLIIEERPL